MEISTDRAKQLLEDLCCEEDSRDVHRVSTRNEFEGG
jgi:hypothetical protein